MSFEYTRASLKYMLFLVLLYTKNNLTNCLNKFTVKRGLLKQLITKGFEILSRNLHNVQ